MQFLLKVFPFLSSIHNVCVTDTTVSYHHVCFPLLVYFFLHLLHRQVPLPTAHHELMGNGDFVGGVCITGKFLIWSIL